MGKERRKKEQEILEAARKEREKLREKGYSEGHIKSTEVWGECPYCGYNVPLDRNPSYDKSDTLHSFSKSDKSLEPKFHEIVKSSACIACGKKFYFIVDGSDLYK